MTENNDEIPKPDIVLDVTGKVCPEPALFTRAECKKLKPGQVLEIRGDFKDAADNVERMAIRQGCEVLKKVKKAGKFSVVVRKK